MKKASRLYDALVVFLGQSQQWADVRHLYVLAWMLVGLIGEGSVNPPDGLCRCNQKLAWLKVHNAASTVALQSSD
jgi:hypothetical protein